MIGLVWNSMMSMAGGWFFLMTVEAFQLKDHDFRLPGIGSYMNEAMLQGNTRAKIAAVIAMTIMIVMVDQIFWRPIVVWSQRFKMDELAQADPPQSWVLNILQKSRLYNGIHKLAAMLRPKAPDAKAIVASTRPSAPREPLWPRIRPIVNWAMALATLGFGLWGTIELAKLLIALPLWGTGNHHDWLGVGGALLASFARTTAAVAIGAAWTLPAGIVIGLSRKWSERLQPIIQVVASFPAPMLFPAVTLLLIELHVPFTVGCVSLMLLGAQWYILFNVIAGASSIPHDLKEVANVYPMSRWEVWTRLYIPCVFPYLLTGMITAAGGAWNATIVAEYTQTPGLTHIAFGLGSLISVATNDGNYPLLAAGVVTMAIFVVLLNRFFWKRLYRLAEERYSLNM